MKWCNEEVPRMQRSFLTHCPGQSKRETQCFKKTQMPGHFSEKKNATDLGKDSIYIPGGTYTFEDHLLSACDMLDVVCLGSSQSPREAPSIFLLGQMQPRSQLAPYGFSVLTDANRASEHSHLQQKHQWAVYVLLKFPEGKRIMVFTLHTHEKLPKTCHQPGPLSDVVGSSLPYQQ